MLITNAYNTKTVILPPKKIDPIILKELLSKSQGQSIKDFIIVMHLKPKKKSLKELIKNAYKENKLAKDMLTTLHKQDSPKARHWPKQIKKLLHYNKSKYSIVNGLIYYRNQVFVPNSPKLELEVVYCIHSLGPAGHLGHIKTLNLLNQTY